MRGLSSRAGRVAGHFSWTAAVCCCLSLSERLNLVQHPWRDCEDASDHRRHEDGASHLCEMLLHVHGVGQNLKAKRLELVRLREEHGTTAADRGHNAQSQQLRCRRNSAASSHTPMSRCDPKGAPVRAVRVIRTPGASLTMQRTISNVNFGSAKQFTVRSWAERWKGETEHAESRCGEREFNID